MREGELVRHYYYSYILFLTLSVLNLSIILSQNENRRENNIYI